MKRVFLYAYDKRNLGDDLFIRTLAGRYPDTVFYLWTVRENRETFRDLPNLKTVEKDGPFLTVLGKLRASLPGRYKALLEKRCSAGVYIGGSLFTEYPDWQRYVRWWEEKGRNGRFFVLGANFGPYRTEAYREGMEKAFRGFEDICFRDRYSLALFPDCPKARWAPDILFSYPMPVLSVKGGQVFVSVIDCAGREEGHSLSRYDKQYVENMAFLLLSYLSHGCTLVLASFCRAEGDERGMEKILRAMGREKDPGIRRLCYDGTNAGALIREIGGSAYVIACRFHAMILAMAAGRPVLPVAYSDKTLRVLEDMDYKGVVFDLREDGRWDYTVSRRNWDEPAPAVPPELGKAALAHFEKLDELLKKEGGRMRPIRKKIPLWIKEPAAVFLREAFDLPPGLILCHVYRSFLRCRGVSAEKTAAAHRLVREKNAAYLEKRYRDMAVREAAGGFLGERPDPAPIWVFWWQGENAAPEIVKRCIASVRRNAGAHPVRMVDRDNYGEYAEIPGYLLEKLENKTMSLTHFSDYLRVVLLARHGGLWLDASVYVRCPVDPMAFEAPFFSVRNPGMDASVVSDWEWTVGVMGAWRGSALFSAARRVLERYWAEHRGALDYFLLDHILKLIFDNCPALRWAIQAVPPNNPGFYLLQDRADSPGEEYPSMLREKGETWLYKLSWKGNYRLRTSDGRQTVFSRWLAENEAETVGGKPK